MTVHSSVRQIEALKHSFGVMSLDRPKSLNSVDLALTLSIHQQLVAWRDDPNIEFVVLMSEHERAFCAGGDIVALYHALQECRQTLRSDHYVYEFFHAEYSLDELIHYYPKPIVVLGQGVVMGGGVGMFMGASHRVVFDNTRFAMPEVCIGLFPDVAGTWMLARLPNGVGELLALSGVSIQAADCVALGLADWWVPGSSAEFLTYLEQADPQAEASPLAYLNQILGGYAKRWALSDSSVMQVYPALRSLARPASVADFTQQLAVLAQQTTQPWLHQAYEQLCTASPLSQTITLALMAQNRKRSVSQTLADDLWVAMQCCARGDLVEGVRALLIDKDRQPVWQHPKDFSPLELERFYRPDWPNAELALCFK